MFASTQMSLSLHDMQHVLPAEARRAAENVREIALSVHTFTIVYYYISIAMTARLTNIKYSLKKSNQIEIKTDYQKYTKGKIQNTSFQT
jgi:hypothetical protein